MTKNLYKMALPLFAVMNGATIYLFWLHLPYGWYPMEMSFVHWGELDPPSEVAATIGLVCALIGMLLVPKISRELKTKLVFFKKEDAHPGAHVFLEGRTGFDRKPLYDSNPAIKESAFDPKVQFEVWSRIRDKHLTNEIVARPQKAWHLLQDLFMMSLIFVGIFLVVWLINYSMPLEIVIRYLFIFGAQTLFLILGSRNVANRYTVNVLAAEMGYKLGDQPGEEDDDKNRFGR